MDKKIFIDLRDIEHITKIRGYINSLDLNDIVFIRGNSTPLDIDKKNN